VKDVKNGDGQFASHLRGDPGFDMAFGSQTSDCRQDAGSTLAAKPNRVGWRLSKMGLE
jgi:hypothetical protein